MAVTMRITNVVHQALLIVSQDFALETDDGSADVARLARAASDETSDAT